MWGQQLPLSGLSRDVLIHHHHLQAVHADSALVRQPVQGSCHRSRTATGRKADNVPIRSRKPFKNLLGHDFADLGG
jgi:hypothetical protein